MSTLATNSEIHTDARRATLNLVAGSLWYAPGSFGIARALSSQYSLRSILFHDIADTESVFTKGLGVTATRKQFEAALRFVVKHYTPVSLQDVIAVANGKPLASRPVLLTFDDAYTSVSDFAAPLCLQLGVPAVFFVNGSCIDNRQIALENLLCYVANVRGLATINAAIQSVDGVEKVSVGSLLEVFSRFLPATSLQGRQAFRSALVRLAGINESELAAEAGLYLNSRQLRDLAKFNFEIGNHTYTHANCRTLSSADFAGEIDRNKAVLEEISGTKVRSFSVPYGSSVDLTLDLSRYLQRSGYKAVFLAEGRANSSPTYESLLDRVSIKASTDAALFSEIEILPRLRTIANRVLGGSDVGHRLRISSLEEIRPTTFGCNSGDRTTGYGEHN
jgi:peptidoglycan/xylan/chitin deacetylase (PgdA/CDA1 family)